MFSSSTSSARGDYVNWTRFLYPPFKYLHGSSSTSLSCFSISNLFTLMILNWWWWNTDNNKVLVDYSNSTSIKRTKCYEEEPCLILPINHVVNYCFDSIKHEKFYSIHKLLNLFAFSFPQRIQLKRIILYFALYFVTTWSLL